MTPQPGEGQHLIAHELAHVAAGDGGIHRDPTGTKEIKGTRVTRAARETKAARGIREISKEISHLPKKSAGIRLSRR